MDRQHPGRGSNRLGTPLGPWWRADLQNPSPAQPECLPHTLGLGPQGLGRGGHRRHLRGAEVEGWSHGPGSGGSRGGEESCEAELWQQLQELGRGWSPAKDAASAGWTLIFPWGRGFSGQAGRDGWPGTLSSPARSTKQEGQSGKHAGKKMLAQGRSPERTEDPLLKTDPSCPQQLGLAGAHTSGVGLQGCRPHPDRNLLGQEGWAGGPTLGPPRHLAAVSGRLKRGDPRWVRWSGGLGQSQTPGCSPSRQQVYINVLV